MQEVTIDTICSYTLQKIVSMVSLVMQQILS